MRTARTLLLLSTLVAACAYRAPALVASPTVVARAPEDTDRLFGERMNAGDVDGLVALYEPGATLVRQDGTPATGHAAIRAELAGILGVKPHVTMNVTKVLRGGGNVAVLYNDWHATGTDRNGKRLTLSGRASEVVRRQPDGTWRFVIDDPDARTPR
jgi:uncharacterized protein (TIGR02246 family)